MSRSSLYNVMRSIALFVAFSLGCALSWIAFCGEDVAIKTVPNTELEFGFGSTSPCIVSEYGWPIVYCRKETCAKRDPLYDNIIFFSPVCLCANAFIVAASAWIPIVVIGYRIVTSWGRPFPTISIRCAFLAIALISFPLGNIALCQLCSNQEMAATYSLQQEGHTVYYCYAGPVWLSRILGSKSWNTGMLGVSGLIFKQGTNDASIDDLLPVLHDLSHVNEIEIDDCSISATRLQEILEAGEEWPLASFSADGTTIDWNKYLETLPFKNLKSISLSRTTLDDNGFEVLCRNMKTLEEVWVRDTDVSTSALDSAMALPRLELLDVRGTSINPEDCSALRSSGVTVYIDE